MWHQQNFSTGFQYAAYILLVALFVCVWQVFSKLELSGSFEVLSNHSPSPINFSLIFSTSLKQLQGLKQNLTGSKKLK